MENKIIQPTKKISAMLNNNNNNQKNVFLQEANENTNLHSSPALNQLVSSRNLTSNAQGFDSLKQKLAQSVASGSLELNTKLKFLGINLNKQESSENKVPQTVEINMAQIRLNNLEKFIKEIRSGMAKCKYRKTLEDILSREELFIDLDDIFWRVREYKIKCMLKILDKKIFRSDAPPNQKQKSIETWTFRIENEIETWIGMLNFLIASENNEAYEEQIESLVHLILEEFYLQAQLKYSLKQYPETAAILGLAEKIIKHFCEFSRSVKVMQSAQKIYLFISSILISDNDYASAKEYQKATARLAFRELFLRSDVEEGINYDSVSKTNQHYLNKIFLNIISAFYQHGVCDENLGNMPNAIDSYKQALWFSNNFVKYQYPEISQFIADVDQRAKNYHKIIKKITDKLETNDFYNSKNSKRTKRNYTEENEAGVTLTSPFSAGGNSAVKKKGVNNKKEKGKGAVFLSAEVSEEFKQMLESIKHQEFEFPEDDKKSERIRMLMSTVNILNNFSSEKFRDIIKLMPNFNLENLDKGLIDKIQKRLNDIRAEKTFSEMEKKRAELKNKIRIIESNNLKAELEQYLNNKEQKTDSAASPLNLNNLNLEKNYKINVNMCLNTEKLLSGRNTEATSPSTNMRKTKTNITVLNSNENYEIKTNGTKSYARPRPQSYRVSKDPAKKIEKFHHSEYIFSNGFQSKLKNINELMKKETEFQKKLLRLKKYEKLPLEIEEINMNAIKDEAKSFFERAKSTYKSGYVLPNESQAKKSNTLKDIEKNKKQKYKEKLQVALIRSLDTKVFSMLEKIKKNEDKNDNLIREEFINNGKTNKNNKFDFVKINSDYEKKIDKDLSFLQKREKMCKKIIEEDIKKLNTHHANKKKSKENSNLNNVNNYTNNNNYNYNQNLNPIDMHNNNFGETLNHYNNFNRTHTAKFPMSTRNHMNTGNHSSFHKNFDSVSGLNKKDFEKNVFKNKPKIDVDKFVENVGYGFENFESGVEISTNGRNRDNPVIELNNMNSNFTKEN